MVKEVNDRNAKKRADMSLNTKMSQNSFGLVWRSISVNKNLVFPRPSSMVANDAKMRAIIPEIMPIAIICG
jgi:hypothetical protein